MPRKWKVLPNYKWTRVPLFRDKYDKTSYPVMSAPTKVALFIFIILCLSYTIFHAR